MASKKLESTFINMVGVLCLVTLISAACLGYVYKITKTTIDQSKESKKLEAVKAVIIDGYDNMPTKDTFFIKSDNNEKLECYPAKKDGKVTSVAVKTYTNKGFSGYISLMVGFLPNGTINKVSVVQQAETPGLGTKILSESFRSQYFGKHPSKNNLKVKKDGGEIDAITAATISSRAFSDAVDRAYKAYSKHISE